MTKLTTRISAATVYPDRVRLTRQGSIKLGKGTHALELPDLPLNINPDSLRTSVYGSAGARLLGVEIKRIYYANQPSEQARKLEQEIEAQQDKLKRNEARLELIKQNRTTLDKLAGQVTTYATAIAAGELSVEQQLEYFGKLRKKSEALDDETVRIQADQRKVNRELERLMKELEQLENTLPYERYTATVNIELSVASDLTIEVSYVVSGASWKPLYDMRLLEKSGNPILEVTYLADVTQNSGEAWEDVSLTLSTARPALTSALPVLDPWYIHPPEPVFPAAPLKLETLVMPTMDAAAMGPQRAPAALAAVPEEKAEEVTAVVHTTGTSVSYLIPTPVSIPPDGTAHKVTIGSFTLAPVLDYVSTPKLAQAVYRRARVSNDSPYTLLPGDANILIVDEYVGTSKLELTVSGASIELYLGSDNRFKVERELKRREVDKRVIGSKRSLSYGYEIRLESMLPGKANLTVYDQIPVSRNEEIKVKLESAEPKPTEHTELNQLVWKLLVEPKEKVALRFDFSIESPHTMKVIGLP